ncbi:hypothetical protein PC116_g12586 [Phytophthora cactorum]|nr:hypothetical protein PC116_g12586 [Phytophthora cactorum]
MTHVRHGLDLFQRQPEPDEGTVVPRSLSAEHVPRENPDYQIVNGQRKRRQRRQRQCKGAVDDDAVHEDGAEENAADEAAAEERAAEENDENEDGA